MEYAPAGVPLSFSTSLDSPSLSVGMTVYDDSGSSPVVQVATFAMTYVALNTYRGKFTALAGKNYIIVKAVYTDGTFTTLNNSYVPESETIVAQDFNTSQPVIGLVSDPNPVVGLVNC